MMAKKRKFVLDRTTKDKPTTEKEKTEEDNSALEPSVENSTFIQKPTKTSGSNQGNGYVCGLNRNTIESWRYPVLVFLSIVALATRLYKINIPDHPTWDEVHFGKMATWYINNEFFLDVHPPLAKMLIALTGALTGYDGKFDYTKQETKYDDYTQYLGMRLVCAVVGTLVVPLCYETVFLLTSSIMAASLAAILLIFDHAMVAISQYILLDQWLLFGIMSAAMGIKRFKMYTDRPFSRAWWVWLVFTGVSLAFTMSVKFVGLFVILYVGLHTITDLWRMLGNLSLSMRHLSEQFLARALCLILLPIVFYSAVFYVHLRILYKSGTGDGPFSTAFQSQLVGNSLNNASMPPQISYGSIVTIKNYRTGGAYLHSHLDTYPDEAAPKQQQVTTYSFKDVNNKWLIKKADQQPDLNDEVEYVKSGDSIRLEHVETRRNLHTHHEKAPITKSQMQVSCYGTDGSGDTNDVFKIEAIYQEPGTTINTVLTQFQLVHLNTHCVVKSHHVKLPKWGFEQLEVACNPYKNDGSSYWNIEEVWDARMPNESFQVYAPSFFSKFYEAHAVMLQENSGLIPKPEEITSKPWQWPLNYKGQPFSLSDCRIYLLGNPIIWWCNTACIPLFGLVYFYHILRAQRGYKDDPSVQDERERTFTSCFWLLLGWALHYLPFWLMGRILYFHHYIPALLFNSMFTAIFIEYIVNAAIRAVPMKHARDVYHLVVGVVLSTILYSFYLFSPMCYCMSGPTADNANSTMYGLKWLDSWYI